MTREAPAHGRALGLWGSRAGFGLDGAAVFWTNERKLSEECPKMQAPHASIRSTKGLMKKRSPHCGPGGDVIVSRAGAIGGKLRLRPMQAPKHAGR